MKFDLPKSKQNGWIKIAEVIISPQQVILGSLIKKLNLQKEESYYNMKSSILTKRSTALKGRFNKSQKTLNSRFTSPKQSHKK